MKSNDMKLKKVCIIDYEVVNIASIENAIKFLNFNYEILKKPNDLKSFSHLILPGVGSFKTGAKKLFDNHWDKAIIRFVREKGFLMGICLGMQLLFEKSYEDGETKGLGLLEGECEIFKSKNLVLPHMGFNLVKHNNSKIWNEIENPSPFYFVHSYRIANSEKKKNISTTKYGESFVSFIEKDNIFGAQFHPEKSHDVGLKLINNFLNL